MKYPMMKVPKHEWPTACTHAMLCRHAFGIRHLQRGVIPKWRCQSSGWAQALRSGAARIYRRARALPPRESQSIQRDGVSTLIWPYDRDDRSLRAPGQSRNANENSHFRRSGRTGGRARGARSEFLEYGGRTTVVFVSRRGESAGNYDLVVVFC
jgi:hypothetical protein